MNAGNKNKVLVIVEKWDSVYICHGFPFESSMLLRRFSEPSSFEMVLVRNKIGFGT